MQRPLGQTDSHLSKETSLGIWTQYLSWDFVLVLHNQSPSMWPTSAIQHQTQPVGLRAWSGQWLGPLAGLLLARAGFTQLAPQHWRRSFRGSQVPAWRDSEALLCPTAQACSPALAPLDLEPFPALS